MALPNPIETRLCTLYEQCRQSVRSEVTRLLVWQATADEAALIETLVLRESGEHAQTSDLFVPLRAPFCSERGHGFALVHELCALYEQAADELETRASSRWRCPVFTRATEGAPRLVDEPVRDTEVLSTVLESFRRHHAGDPTSVRLVLWLEPSERSAPDTYRRWLHKLVRDVGPHLKFLAIDDVVAPTLAGLSKVEPERVVTCACALDLPSAFIALARGAGETPGDRLRLLQTELAAAVAEGAVPRAEALAVQATQLATEQGWRPLAASVQMMLAAGMVSAARPLDALRAYGLAEQLVGQPQPACAAPAPAVEVDHAPVETGLLQLHAKLGRATVLLGLCSHARAAELYLECATLARALADPRLTLDGYRLASVCFGLSREPTRAWRTGMQGLELALGLDEPTRQSSTLLYLAEHLVRLTRSFRELGAYDKPLTRQLAELLGPDWPRQLGAQGGGVPHTSTPSL